MRITSPCTYLPLDLMTGVYIQRNERRISHEYKLKHTLCALYLRCCVLQTYLSFLLCIYGYAIRINIVKLYGQLIMLNVCARN